VNSKLSGCVMFSKASCAIGVRVMKRILLSSLFVSAAFAAPNDPYFAQQWGLNNDGTQTVAIDVDPLHTIMQTGVSGVDVGYLAGTAEISKMSPAPVTVAVIDSGIDMSHPDLANRYAPGGWDFIQGQMQKLLHRPQTEVIDPMGHGTHVSGIIAANADNGVGITGVAPSSVRILPLRILLGDPNNTSDDYQNFAYPDPVTGKQTLISDYAAAAVSYAEAHGAKIINLSLGWPKLVDTKNAQTVFEKAIQDGVLIIAAAGNDRKDQPTYPCSYEGVICVGSVTNNGSISVYSNYGGVVDILAPGDGIVSTYPTYDESDILRIQGYEMLSGTSQASPMVAGIAAAVLSVMPTISLNELQARLLVSGATLPSPNAALYGLVNLKRALDAQPQPVFLPDLKSIDQVAINESTLQASGQVPIKNLWADATGVQAEISVNGKPAGTAQAATLASGATLTVPWTYSFGSVDESSTLVLTLMVSDAKGDSKTFSATLPAVRPMEKITSQRTINIANVPVSAWMGTQNGHYYSNLSQVSSYPSESELPRYYMQHRNAQGGVDYGASGSLVDVFDPSKSNTITTVFAFGIQQITQLIRMDVNGDGNMDYVVLGLGNIQGKNPYFQFDFFDPSFNPLFSSQAASSWQVGLNNAYGQSIIRNYAARGSWIATGNTAGPKLVPCFIDQGTLPAPDNYNGTDMRAYNSDSHLFYLAPQAMPTGSAFVPLTIRVLDSANFRNGYPDANLHLQSQIPQDPADQKSGHIRVITQMGDDINSPTDLWDITSLNASILAPAPNWDAVGSTGQALTALSTDLASPNSVFLTFFGDTRASIAWTSPEGQYLESAEFQFSSTGNTIQSLIGSVDLQSLGRFWFVEANFDLVGYHEASPGSALETKIIPIERDSSFPGQQFSQSFQTVLVGTAANPEPGIYIDSTLVRGNQVAVAVWDPASGTFDKPLRYSLQIPDNCLEMNPFKLTSSAESFAIPLLCQSNNQMQLNVIVPQPAQ
jgi:cell wall-associated protease